MTSGDYKGKATRGNFPELGLDLVFDSKGIAVFPQKIVALDGGRRDFKVTGLKPGAYEIAFKMGQTIVARKTVVVLSATDAKTAATAEIRAPGTLFLGEDKDALVVMKTKYGTPLLDSPFEGRYKLTLLKGKAKFCNVSQIDEKTACRTENLAEELEFSYEETYRGALRLKMRAYSFAPIAMQLVRIDGKKPVSVTRTARDVGVLNPRGLDSTYAYYAENVSALSKGWFPLKDGYLLQDREMVASQAKELVRRYSGYRWLKAGNDFTRKRAIKVGLARFEQDFGKSDDFARMTRGQLADLLLRAKGETPASDGSKGFTDETGTWKDAIATLRVKYGFKWTDQFGERYFQPDKTVTVGEALYLAEKIGF